MTDVEGSTELWEWDRVVMMEAITLHDRIMRASLAKYGPWLELSCSSGTQSSMVYLVSDQALVLYVCMLDRKHGCWQPQFEW